MQVTELKSEPLETQRLLWASEIQGLQFTVILDRERQARTSVCHLHLAELDGEVSTDEASATTLKWLGQLQQRLKPHGKQTLNWILVPS